MMQESTFKMAAPTLWKRRALGWAATFPQVCFLEHNGQHEYPHGPFPNLMAVGARQVWAPENGQAFASLSEKLAKQGHWYFGFWGYDLKNELESLQSEGAALTGFPESYFFEPAYLLRFEGSQVRITTWDGRSPKALFDQISRKEWQETPRPQLGKPLQLVTEQEYLEKVERIRHHIAEGDVYELNYCIPFQVEQAELSPEALFFELMAVSPMPFSVFFKLGDQYLLSASPERFLKKEGRQLISQPIKGTAKRGNTPEQDETLKSELWQSEKERAENMMIVDLVRNDLARSAERGSVKVPELFGIYSFEQLHQMISTVTATLPTHENAITALAKAFPMGSMTGAPKIEAMKLIDSLEVGKRGLFSGSVGFIAPHGDFDFNVVIRSLFYDRGAQVLSWWVGSAITYDSSPVAEYQECMLKAEAIKKILFGD